MSYWSDIETGKVVRNHAKPPGNWCPTRTCQDFSGDVCILGNRTGITCPDDECDIETGLRPMPADIDYHKTMSLKEGGGNG